MHKPANNEKENQEIEPIWSQQWSFKSYVSGFPGMNSHACGGVGKANRSEFVIYMSLSLYNEAGKCPPGCRIPVVFN